MVGKRKEGVPPRHECVIADTTRENVPNGDLPRFGLDDPFSTEIDHVLKGPSTNNRQTHIVRSRFSGASPLQDQAIVAMEDETGALAIFTAEEEEKNTIVLDPENSERQYYSDPFTGLQREIWHPGDGDGDKSIDYYEWSGPPPPLEKRRRFYQLPTGHGPIKRSINEPPKYVILDDHAAYEVLASDIHRKTLAVNWPHDFAHTGKIRFRRPHRGRGAVGDPDAAGDDKYHFGKIGNQGERYFFTGEKDYMPIVYRSSNESSMATSTTQAQAPKHTATTQTSGHPKPTKPPGHNQHTHPLLLVKNGAPSLRQRRQGPAKLKRSLRRNPILTIPDERLERGASQPENNHCAALPEIEQEAHPTPAFDDGQGLFVSPDTSNRVPRDIGTTYEPADGGSSDMEEFPFHHRSTSAVKSTTPVHRSTGPPRKKQLFKHDLFPSHLSKQGTTDESENTDGDVARSPQFDYRSYASQLEEQLQKARKTIEEQGDEIDLLKKARRKHPENMVQLRSETTVLKSAEEREEGLGNGEQGKQGEDEYDDDDDDELDEFYDAE